MEFSITILLVGITSLISYQALSNRNLFDTLKHYPYLESKEKQYYRLLSSGFVHGDMNHLLINMFVLWQFGTQVESLFLAKFGMSGRIYFLLFYLAILVISDLPTHLKHRNNPRYTAIGASGATSGIVFVYVLQQPWNWFLFPPLPGILMAVGYLWYSSWASKNSRDNIGHSAHFWGAVAGVVLSIILIPELLNIFADQILKPQAPPFF